MAKTVAASVHKIPKQSLAAVAYETIIKKIICLDYEPSRHLEENQLVEELGIGRTPIREALVRLQGERMLESHPNRGVIVRPITLQNTKAMFESMRVIELGIAELAVTKEITPLIHHLEQANALVKKAIQSGEMFDLVEYNHQFHINFAKCSQNEFLVRAEHDVRNEAKRLSYLSYITSVGPEQPLERHYESVVQEHDEIILSLCDKRLSDLRQLIDKHIQTFKERIITFMMS